MKQIILASSNPGKIKEFKEIFAQFDIEIIPQTEFDIPDAIEDGLSFIENAIIKARNCSRHTGLPAIADDSGLEVSMLDGRPGIYSARYAGTHGDSNANNNKLLKDMENITDRSARFVCAIAYTKHANDPTPIISVGYLNGEIGLQKQGSDGFGYDPLFILKDLNESLAEVSKDYKNQISHRAKAIDNFIKDNNMKNI